ncbi:MAG: hypothetical protein AAFN43_08050, partial [Pseudomonadota bacterium]
MRDWFDGDGFRKLRHVSLTPRCRQRSGCGQGLESWSGLWRRGGNTAEPVSPFLVERPCEELSPGNVPLRPG